MRKIIEPDFRAAIFSNNPARSSSASAFWAPRRSLRWRSSSREALPVRPLPTSSIPGSPSMPTAPSPAYTGKEELGQGIVTAQTQLGRRGALRSVRSREADLSATRPTRPIRATPPAASRIPRISITQIWRKPRHRARSAVQARVRPSGRARRSTHRRRRRHQHARATRPKKSAMAI